MTPSSWKGIKDKIVEKPTSEVNPQSSPVFDIFKDSEDNVLSPAETKTRGSELTRSKSQPRVAGISRGKPMIFYLSFFLLVTIFHH